jgi:hypothetical protein
MTIRYCDMPDVESAYYLIRNSPVLDLGLSQIATVPAAQPIAVPVTTIARVWSSPRTDMPKDGAFELVISNEWALSRAL